MRNNPSKIISYLQSVCELAWTRAAGTYLKIQSVVSESFQLDIQVLVCQIDTSSSWLNPLVEVIHQRVARIRKLPHDFLPLECPYHPCKSQIYIDAAEIYTASPNQLKTSDDVNWHGSINLHRPPGQKLNNRCKFVWQTFYTLLQSLKFTSMAFLIIRYLLSASSLFIFHLHAISVYL